MCSRVFIFSDIPRSDEESDGTAPTVLEIFLPTERPGINLEFGTNTEATPAQPEKDMAYDAEYMDYDAEGEDEDAEGEDDDEAMEGVLLLYMQYNLPRAHDAHADYTSPTSSLTNHVFSAGWGHVQGMFIIRL
jgi:hypothetical protein